MAARCVGADRAGLGADRVPAGGRPLERQRRCSTRTGWRPAAGPNGSFLLPGRLPSTITTHAGFGYHWWPLDGAGDRVTADGMRGQFVYVDRPRRTVVVKTSAWPTRIPGGTASAETCAISRCRRLPRPRRRRPEPSALSSAYAPHTRGAPVLASCHDGACDQRTGREQGRRPSPSRPAASSRWTARSGCWSSLPPRLRGARRWRLWPRTPSSTGRRPGGCSEPSRLMGWSSAIRARTATRSVSP